VTAPIIPPESVLHRVRQRQQHDQIERIELRQFALAENAQQQHQENVDDDRPDDFLDQRNRKGEEVCGDFVHGTMMRLR